MKQALVQAFKDLKHGFGTSYDVQPQKIHSGNFCGIF